MSGMKSNFITMKLAKIDELINDPYATDRANM